MWQTGTITGDGGTIQGNVLNHGLMSPANSPGVLTIEGDYTRSNHGWMKMGFAGLDVGLTYDQLHVNRERTRLPSAASHLPPPSPRG